MEPSTARAILRAPRTLRAESVKAPEDAKLRNVDEIAAPPPDDARPADVAPPDFRRVFESAPGPVMLLTPDLVILAVSDAFVTVSLVEREELVGRHLFEVFPDNPDAPDDPGSRNLRASLERVRRHLVPDVMPVQRYDVQRPGSAGGGFEERDWTPVNAPILELERLAQELAEAGRAADAQHTATLAAEREVRRLKEEFLATVSHELRTPLTSVIGYLDLVLEGGYPLDAEVAGHLEVARRNGQRLEALVADLLLIAQAQAGRLPLSRRAVDLPPLIELAVATAQPAADAAGLRMEQTLRDVPAVDVDPIRIGQLLDNLISNAVKFTPRGGTVRAALERRPDAVRISVTDTGPGIPSEERPRLFDRFFRTAGAVEGGISGTGLGLAIAKAIAEAHGGTIGLHDARESGSTFYVDLPLAGTASEDTALRTAS